jgi:hypothetical protein
MWEVGTTEEFDAWFSSLEPKEQEEIIALIGVVRLLGPETRRPYADSLKGSAYSNMKELRARTASSVLRIAFAFDPLQNGILLIGGNKSGVSQKRFYKVLIARADEIYRAHLVRVAEEIRKRDAASKSRNRKDKGR